MPRYKIPKDATCKEDQCNSKVIAKGFCNRHYMLLVRNAAYHCRVTGCNSRRVSKQEPVCYRHRNSDVTALNKTPDLDRCLRMIGERAIEIDKLREKVANLQKELSEYTMWEGSEAELQEALLQDTHVITIHNK